MKRILLLLALATFISCTNAQKTDANTKTKPDSGTKQQTAQVQEEAPGAPVKPRPIPDYRILTTDSVWVTPAELHKGKPVVIIYFSPDCSHCQRMMYEMKPKFNELKNVQFVMITWSLKWDIRAIKEFRRDYGLKDFANFIIGTEGYTKKVQDYYDVHTTPYIAMYDSKGKWVKGFDKVPKTEDVIAGAKSLK